MLSITCKFSSQIFPHLLWLSEPLTSSTATPFQWTWPWLGGTRSAQSKTCWVHFLVHFSAALNFSNTFEQHEIWYSLEVVQAEHPVSVSVSVSAQDGIIALGKAHTCSAPSLSSLPKVSLETVPIFAWLNTDRSRPLRVECRPLPFSTPLSFRRSVLWCSGLSVLRKFLKPLSTSALPSCRPDVISAVLASLSARSFPLTLACLGQ